MRLRSKANLDGEKEGGAGSKRKGRPRKKIRDGGVKKTFRQDGPGGKRLLRSFLQFEISANVVSEGVDEAKEEKTEVCKKRLLRSCPQNEIAVDEAKEGKPVKLKTETCKKRPAAKNKPRAKGKARSVKRSAPSRQDRDSPPPKRAPSPRQSTSKLTSEKEGHGKKEIGAGIQCKTLQGKKLNEDGKKEIGAGSQCKTLQGKKLNEGKKRLLRSCPQNEIAANLVAVVDKVKEGKPVKLKSEACKKRPAAKNKPRAEGKELSVKRSAPSRQDWESPPPKRAPSPSEPTSKIETEKGNVNEGQTASSIGPIKRRRRRPRGKKGLARAVSVRQSAPPGSDVQAVFLVEAPKDGRIIRNVILAPALSSPSSSAAPPLSMPLLNVDSESDHQPAPENRPPLCETDNSGPPSVTGCGGSLDLSPIKSEKWHVLESQISHISIENNDSDKSNCVNESETPDNLKPAHKEELNLCTSQVLKNSIGQTTFQEINSLPNDNICALEKNSQGTSTKIPHVSGFNSLVTSCDMIKNYDRTDCLQCSSSFSGDGDDILVENCPLASETASNNNSSCYPKITCDEMPSSIENITEDIGYPQDNVDRFLQEIIPQELNTVSEESSKDVQPAKIEDDKVHRAPLYCESSLSIAPVEEPKEFQNLAIISESEKLSDTNEITDISGSDCKKVEGFLKQFCLDIDVSVEVSGVQNIANPLTSPDREILPHQSPDDPHDNDWDFKRFPSSARRKSNAIIDDSPGADVGEEKPEPFKMREKKDNTKLEKVRPKNKKKTSSGAKESVFPLFSPVDEKTVTIGSSSAPSQDTDKPSTSVTPSKEEKDKVKPKTCAEKDIPNKLTTAEAHSNIKHMKSGPRAKFSVVPSSKHSLSDIKTSVKEPNEKWKIVHSEIPLTKPSLANSVPKPVHGIKMKFIKSSPSNQRETMDSSSRPENKLVTTSKESPATTLSKNCPDKKFKKIPKTCPKKNKNEEVTKVAVTADNEEIATKTSPFRQKEINKPSSGSEKKSVAETVSFLEESTDTTPSESIPDKELRLKNLKPIPRKKKTEEVVKTVKKAEPVKENASKDKHSSTAIEKKSSHTLHKTSSKDTIEVSKKSSIPEISHVPTLKDNNDNSTEEKSSSSFGKKPSKVSNPCEPSLNGESALSSSNTESVFMAYNRCHCEELSHDELDVSVPGTSQSSQGGKPPLSDLNPTPLRSDPQPSSNSGDDGAKLIENVTSTASGCYPATGVHTADNKGCGLPTPLKPYCRGRLLRNSCRRNYCNWKHEFTPEFFSRLSSNDLQCLIRAVLREAVEVSSSFIWAVLEFFVSSHMKAEVLWLSGEFLRKELRPSIRCKQYFIKMSQFFFSALNYCGIQKPFDRAEIIEANKSFFESLSNETINNILSCWGINSLKPLWPVVQPLAEMEEFVFSDFLLQKVFVEIMASPNKKTMELYGKQLLKLKPDRQRFFDDPSRHCAISNFIEKLPDFGLEYLCTLLRLKYSKIPRKCPKTLEALLSEAGECFHLATLTRQWKSSIDCLIKALNTYRKGNFRVEKELLRVIFKVFNVNEPLMNLKDFLMEFTWTVKEQFFAYHSFFGTLIYLFVSNFSRDCCWPVALGFLDLLKQLSISPDCIMDMEEEPSTPLLRAMLFSEILFHNEYNELLVQFITSPNGFTLLFQEPVEESPLNIEKSIDLLDIYLAELINLGEIQLALALFRFILKEQKCNEPVSLLQYFESIITQLIEKNGLTEEPLKLYSDLDSALDGYVNPSCLYLRTLLIIALKFDKTDLIIDLFQKCLTAGCYPNIGMKPYTIRLLRSMTQDEMMMYISGWIVDFRRRHFEGLRPPNATPSEDGRSPQAAYEIKISFSPNRLTDYYDASSPPVIPNVLSEVRESLDECALRVQAALQEIGLALRSTQRPLYLHSALFEDMWGYSWDYLSETSS